MLMTLRYSIGFLTLLSLLFLTIGQPKVAIADEINPGVYPIDSVVEGKSYELTTISFWQWFLGTPATGHPVVDETGENCGRNQDDHAVFFLAFSGGGSVERTCEIPAGSPILVPINVGVCTLAEYPDATIEELHTCAEEDESSNPGLFLSVDGREFIDLERYRVHSEAFEIILPSDPLFAEPGPTSGVSDGYWVILEPLSAGQHEVHFKASLSNPTTGILFYRDDVIYHLNIVKGGGEPIQLTANSNTGEFGVNMEWISNEIGEENTFTIHIINSEGNSLSDATYDIVLYKNDQRLDDSFRSSQTATEQRYIFSDEGSYEIRIENINGNGASDYVSMPIKVTPEFPVGLYLLLAPAIGMIIAVVRFRGILGNILNIS